jgi:hypothetical protein
MKVQDGMVSSVPVDGHTPARIGRGVGRWATRAAKILPCSCAAKFFLFYFFYFFLYSFPLYGAFTHGLPRHIHCTGGGVRDKDGFVTICS